MVAYTKPQNRRKEESEQLRAAILRFINFWKPSPMTFIYSSYHTYLACRLLSLVKPFLIHPHGVLFGILWAPILLEFSTNILISLSNFHCK